MRPEVTAIHEAAHAVVAYKLDRLLGRTTIVPCGDYMGSAQSEECCFVGDTLSEGRVREEIVILFAGNAAQMRLDPTLEGQGCGKDDEDAARLLALFDSFNEAALRREAAEHVAAHWPAIQAVATALLRDKTLADDEVCIIFEAFEEGEDWVSYLTEYRVRRDALSSRK